jgi:hypothetical protein
MEYRRRTLSSATDDLESQEFRTRNNSIDDRLDDYTTKICGGMYICIEYIWYNFINLMCNLRE